MKRRATTAVLIATDRLLVSALELVGSRRVTSAAAARTLLLRSGEIPNFTVRGEPESWLTTWGYVTSGVLPGKFGWDRALELRKAGFLADAKELLRGPARGGGHSSAMAFKSAAGADTVMAIEVERTSEGFDYSGGFTAFTVPGVPAAHGLAAAREQSGVAIVYWVHDRFRLKSAIGTNPYARNEERVEVAALIEPLVRGIQTQHERIENTA
jgi:hypothetical protein